MVCHRPVVSSWWGWGLTLASFVLFFLAFGPIFNYSILFVSLQKEFDTSEAITGWLGSTATALACFGSLLGALLERKLSKRTFILLGVCLNSLGLLATSFVPSIGYAYLTYGLTAGLGANFMVQPAIVILMDRFQRKNFARSSAIAQFGSSCGMLVFSQVLTLLIAEFGWRKALRFLVVGIFVVGMRVGYLITDLPTTEGAIDTAPSGDVAQEVSDERRTRKSAVGEVTEGGGGGDASDVTTAESEGRDGVTGRDPVVEGATLSLATRRGLVALLLDFEAWAWFVGIMFNSLGWTFFQINYGSFMDEIGLDDGQIADVISCFAAGDLGGKVLVAVVGDRLPFSHVYVLAASGYLGTAMLGILTVTRTYVRLAILAVVCGVLQALFNSPMFVAGAQLFRAKYGSNDVMVLCLFPVGIGVLVSAPLSGGLHDVTGDYVLSLVVIVAIFLAGSTALLAVPLRRKLMSRRLCCSRDA